MPGQKLVCIDFDQTLVKGHFHGFLRNTKMLIPNDQSPGVQIMQPDRTFLRKDPQSKAFVSVPSVAGRGARKEQVEEFLNNPLLGLKNPVEIAMTIRSILDHGHKVAIVSFTLYPEVIIPTLRLILQIGDKDNRLEHYLSQIGVFGGFPSDNNPVNSPIGKEEHIFEAMRYFEVSLENTMLVDDSEHNLNQALNRTHMPKENLVQVSKLPNVNPNLYVPKILDFVKDGVFKSLEMPFSNPDIALVLQELPAPVIPKYTQERRRANTPPEVSLNHDEALCEEMMLLLSTEDDLSSYLKNKKSEANFKRRNSSP